MINIKKKIKASVLIANYNNERFLKQCLNSIFNQTYKNIEVIVFDDGSSDNSVKKLKKVKNIILLTNNKKKSIHGCYNQINAYKKAFEKSSGDIIFFLDSDDFFVKNKIETVINYFNKNKKKKIIFDLPIIIKKNKKRKVSNNFFFFKTYWPYIPPQSCISIERKIFPKLLSKIQIKGFPDIWLDFRIAIFSKYILKDFCIFNKNLTFYRKIYGNVSSNFKYLGTSWWQRRFQAHKFVISFFKINKIKHNKNYDFFLTKTINNILN